MPLDRVSWAGGYSTCNTIHSPSEGKMRIDKLGAAVPSARKFMFSVDDTRNRPTEP